MLHRHPLRSRELLDNPVAAEASEPAVLLATEWIVRKIIDWLIVDMGHADFHFERKGQSAIFILRNDGAGQSGIGVIGDPQGFSFIPHLDDRRDWTEDFLFRNCMLILDI